MSVHLDSRVFSQDITERLSGLRAFATVLERDLSFTHDGGVVTVEADWEAIVSQREAAERFAKEAASREAEERRYERSMEG